MARTKIVSSLLPFLFFVSSFKCFVVDTVKNKGLGEACSTLFCSNQVLATLYENSKSVLNEMETLLFDLRDEKATHQLEHELNKRLDYEIKLPTFAEYNKEFYKNSDLKRDEHLDDLYRMNYDDNIYDLDFDYDDDEENEENEDMNKPVPFLVLHTDDADAEEEIQEDNLNEEMNEFSERPLTQEESIDIALSRIHELEETEKNRNEAKSSNNIKRYLR